MYIYPAPIDDCGCHVTSWTKALCYLLVCYEGVIGSGRGDVAKSLKSPSLKRQEALDLLDQSLFFK